MKGFFHNRKRTRIYKVESQYGYYMVKARNKKSAYSDGVKEYGRGRVNGVTIPTDEEVKSYLAAKGEKAIEEI